MRTIFTIAFITLIMACSPKAQTNTSSTQENSTDQAITQSAAPSTPTNTQSGPMEISFMDKEQQGHCQFFAQGDGYDPSNRSTWKQLMVILSKAPTSAAIIKIGNSLKKLNAAELTEFEGGETRFYMAGDGSGVAIRVTMNKGSATEYTGSIRMVAPKVSEPIDFVGSCG